MRQTNISLWILNISGNFTFSQQLQFNKQLTYQKLTFIIKFSIPMKSLTKPSRNTTKKKSQPTTLSAHRFSKNRFNNQQPQLVSPFEIEYKKSQPHQIPKIKDINYQYIQLFTQLFRGSKYIGALNMPEESSKLTRDQRYEYQSMKLLKDCGQKVERLKILRKTAGQWEKVQQYLKQKQLQEVGEKRQSKKIVQAANLVGKYIQVSKSLAEADEKYRLLVRQSEASLENLSDKQDRQLSKVERQFKKAQRKLRKIMDEESYYEKKCQYQKAVLQSLNSKKSRTQDNRINIQMRVIAQKSKRDRLMRKSRQKREKSSLKQNQSIVKLNRSKSAVRGH